MTLAESAAGAVMPWNSIDAVSDQFDSLPQQCIDICLMCQHCADHCEHCGDWNANRNGRPRKEVDFTLLREMLALKKCNREICSALGISTRKLQYIKKEMGGTS